MKANGSYENSVATAGVISSLVYSCRWPFVLSPNSRQVMPAKLRHGNSIDIVGWHAWLSLQIAALGLSPSRASFGDRRLVEFLDDSMLASLDFRRHGHAMKPCSVSISVSASGACAI
jgi:hypothetical protein